jgi:hypothetical protein
LAEGAVTLNELELPADLVDFLTRGNELEFDGRLCEPDRITLVAFDDLQLTGLWVTTENTVHMYSDHTQVSIDHTRPYMTFLFVASQLWRECDDQESLAA